MEWQKILNDKKYSEKMAFDILTSLSYDKDDAPPFPQLVKETSVPSLYGKHMMKKYFVYGENIERPDIQSETLNLGIEVTRLIDNDVASSMKAFNQAMADKKLSNKSLEDEIKKKDNRGKFVGQLENSIIGEGVYFNTSNIGDILSTEITNKLNLLDTYEQFNEYWLFMFSLSYIEEKELLDRINSIDGHEKFSTYIFVSAANNKDLWFIHSPYTSVEKRISLGAGGVRNE